MIMGTKSKQLSTTAQADISSWCMGDSPNYLGSRVAIIRLPFWRLVAVHGTLNQKKGQMGNAPKLWPVFTRFFGRNLFQDPQVPQDSKP